MSGETNRLLGLAKELHADPDPRELDVIASTGEAGQHRSPHHCVAKPGSEGAQLHRRAGSASSQTMLIPRRASLAIDDANIRKDLTDGCIVVVAGFQGVDEQGNITTLGRGGSDTTGVALAAALKADECQIYTDVDGVYTTDPRVEPDARRLKTVTFEEMLELASLGSKVLQIRSVEFAGKYKVKLRVLSSFTPVGLRRHGYAHHIRGRREHGTSHHLRHRLQPR